MKKYFAVKIGHTPGIYNNWNDAKRQVNGYPRNHYKGKTKNFELKFRFFQVSITYTAQFNGSDPRTIQEPVYVF